MPLVFVQLVENVTPIYWCIISYYSQRMGLIFSGWGNFLHCKHRSWKSNIPLWQQRGEVINNLRFYALASPSLPEQSGFSRQLEKMFIAVILATGGGRKGGKDGGSHTLLAAVSFSLELIEVSWGDICPVSAGSYCGREGHLLCSHSPWEWWIFEIQNILCRWEWSLNQSFHHSSIKAASLQWCEPHLKHLQVKRACGSGLSLKTEKRVTKTVTVSFIDYIES